MQEILKIILGTLVLILGIPIGNFLKSKTEDEQKSGQIWFRILTIVGLLGGIVGLILKEDWLLFTSFFIAIVTSRNLK